MWVLGAALLPGRDPGVQLRDLHGTCLVGLNSFPMEVTTYHSSSASEHYNKCLIESFNTRTRSRVSEVPKRLKLKLNSVGVAWAG